MRCRRKKDRDIVDQCELTEEGLSKWIDELFDSGVMEPSVLEWGKQVMMTNYKQASDKKIKRLVLWKVIHTREVVEAGRDVYENLGEERLVETVCFLHDIGRFKQAHLGGYADEVVRFDHAEEGAKMIEEINLVGLVGLEKEMMVEAVRWHSRKKYEGDNFYAKLVRDADKLALCRYAEELLNHRGLGADGITPGAWNDFVVGEMVKHEHLKTKVDMLLCRLSWKWDLNLESTYKRFEEEGIWRGILGKLERLIDGDKWEIVKNKIA